jgi:hypothetical protein
MTDGRLPNAEAGGALPLAPCSFLSVAARPRDPRKVPLAYLEAPARVGLS